MVCPVCDTVQNVRAGDKVFVSRLPRGTCGFCNRVPYTVRTRENARILRTRHRLLKKILGDMVHEPQV